MSGPKSRDTIYVRIDPEVRQSFQQFVLGRKKDGVSEKRVIERLLRDFMSLSDEERMGVLRSERVDPVGVFGDLIYQFTWADHAFSTGQWAWAIEEYRRLREMASAAPGIRLISTYKLGYSWLDVANSLRREAVQQYALADGVS